MNPDMTVLGAPSVSTNEGIIASSTANDSTSEIISIASNAQVLDEEDEDGVVRIDDEENNNMNVREEGDGEETGDSNVNYVTLTTASVFSSDLANDSTVMDNANPSGGQDGQEALEGEEVQEETVVNVSVTPPSSQSSESPSMPSEPSNDAFANPDENLEPVDRLEKYSVSDITFHRQVVAKSVLETLQDVYEKENEVQRVTGVIRRLASDPEPSVRAELVEQIPHIALYCETQVKCLSNVVPLSVLPILEQFLTDSNSQVRKMTQGAFVMMLDQGLIKNDSLEKQICPLLIQLTDFSNLDDYRIDRKSVV